MTNGMDPYIKDEMAMRNEGVPDPIEIKLKPGVDIEDVRKVLDGHKAILITIDEFTGINNEQILHALKLACACMAENLDCPMYQPDSDGFNSANGCLVNCDDAKQANCWESYWRWRAAR